MSPRNTDGGRSMLSLVNRISGIGGLTAVVVGLALAAIVQQEFIGPSASGARSASAAGRAPGDDDAGRTTTRAQGTQTTPQPSPLERDVRAAVLAQRGDIARRSFGDAKTALPAPKILVSRSDKKRTWAFGTAAIPPPAGVAALPDASFFIARRTGGSGGKSSNSSKSPTGWQVQVIGGTQNKEFTRLLKAAPTSVVPKDERSALNHFASSPPALSKPGTTTGLTLPWAAGQSWAIDQVGGDRSELAFSGGDGKVLAPGNARLYRLCSTAPGHGLLLLVHDNGLASAYYQLNSVTGVPDGTRVKAGAYLGHVSTDQPCGGGTASGSDAGAGAAGAGAAGAGAAGGVGGRLRFALLCADHPVPLDRTQIGGWTFHLSGQKLSAERAGLQVTAGNPLLNLGAAAILPTPPPVPSPASPSPGKSAKALVPKAPAVKVATAGTAGTAGTAAATAGH